MREKHRGAIVDSIGNAPTQAFAASAGDDSAASSPGDMLGQYRIVQMLGGGGMGEVYEVEHATLELRYAIKLLPADFASDPRAVERFRREAKVMAQLEHPHIVRVDEFGETDGRYWLRMELATRHSTQRRRPAPRRCNLPAPHCRGEAWRLSCMFLERKAATTRQASGLLMHGRITDVRSCDKPSSVSGGGGSDP